MSAGQCVCECWSVCMRVLVSAYVSAGQCVCECWSVCL